MSDEYSGFYSKDTLTRWLKVAEPLRQAKEQKEFEDAVEAIVDNFRQLKQKVVTAKPGTVMAEGQEFVFLYRYVAAQASIFSSEFSEHLVKGFGLDKISEVFKEPENDI